MDLTCTRSSYTAKFWCAWASNLKPPCLEDETLPAGPLYLTVELYSPNLALNSTSIACTLEFRIGWEHCGIVSRAHDHLIPGHRRSSLTVQASDDHDHHDGRGHHEAAGKRR
ncbi:hypothetical protein AVEN_24170-1 [Araneus ventricosus]|uniref:Uncharacterized protein n=1 Tax=Araneus ventricosus TaxID=182803 RepID=A0A4Y2HSN4_ARAVE|nr:hypothetical protein AVEN_24170-1 [Araneus ventricosus]